MSTTTAPRRDQVNRPKLLDLFSGAGGAGEGYHRAGFDVTGVDIEPMPRYPHAFVQADAMEYLMAHGDEFDAIHASPPCQRFSAMTKRHAGRSAEHPDYVDATRDILLELGKPYVIENVMGAPLRDPITLCGSMFDLKSRHYGLRRHRLFEASFPITPPGSCAHYGQALGVYGKPGGSSKRDGLTFATLADWKVGMGVGWMTFHELAESIPPAYTEWIGQALAHHLKEHQ